MPLELVAEHLHGIKVLQPPVFHDDRGFFMESFSARDFAAHGLPTHFPQDNQSRSTRGVLRGMHFQWDEPMGKLLRVIRGAITLVEVDIRHGSPTLGHHVAIELDDVSNRMVWIPPGFANGFYVHSDEADVFYKCSAQYNPKAESGIHWNSFGMSWPTTQPHVSAKDDVAQTLEQWLEREESRNFRY